MTMQEFIEENRDVIDDVILSYVPGSIDDEEREMWVRNNEYLYGMALDAEVEEL